jgi:D-alanyl-D-alanine carboxypeptidase
MAARVLLTLAAASSLVLPAAAAAPVSEIVIDAGTGRVLYAARPGIRRAPASLAKMMTLLLVFEALDKGRLRPGDQLVMTGRAARQPPSRLGVAPGGQMPVRSAMRAVAVVSANDVAVAFAERLGGSEAGFVRMMNRRASALGMRDTQFTNATGLAPRGGLTTARDMALLARYLVGHHRDRYDLFATRSIRWHGASRPNHNRLLGHVRGVDGLKTGYTVEAGFNLAASSLRKGKRMIVVVLGAQTAAARDLLVANLLESGFSSPRATPSRRRR